MTEAAPLPFVENSRDNITLGDTHPLTGKFLANRLKHALTEREKDLLEAAVDRTESFSGQKVVLRRGQCLDASTILIEGFMLRVMEEGGQRHIVAVHVPGDFVDLHAFPLKRLDHDVVSVGKTRVGCIPHERLEQIVADEPHLARLLWSSTLLDAAIHREWIMKLEQLTGDGRLAHLMCEIWQRLDFVGLARTDGFRLPLMQFDLAQACGTTAIHMNRILRKLREEGIMTFRGGRVTVPDRRVLEARGQFCADYLYGPGSLHVGEELSV